MPHSLRRIVLMNRSYWPDIEATGQLLTDLCEGLTLHYDVHVICGQPNSPEPNSSFLPVGIAKRNGVTVHRLAHRQFEKKNPFGRILNLLSFFFAAERYLRTCDLSADIVVTETDPFLLPLAGARYARRVGAKHCVYLQDIYPDVAQAVGKVRVPGVAPLIRRKLRAAYREAAQVIVLGPCMGRRLTESPWQLDPAKIDVVPNWSDCDAITPIDPAENEFRKRFCDDDSFVVMHSGNMGLTQRLEVLISAAADPAWPDRAKLLLVGNGASRDQLLAHAEAMNLPTGRVRFVNYQPRNRLAESLSAADVHVVSMDQGVTGCLCPSKLYGIMAAARPVIAVADASTDLCQTIVKRGLGWTVPPGRPAEIAKAVAKAEAETRQSVGPSDEAALRRRRARETAINHFDRPVILARFAALLDRMLSDRRIKLSQHQLPVTQPVEQLKASDTEFVATL